MPALSARFAHIFFMDGVGLGDDDPATNPFVTAHLPVLTGLLGEKWYVKDRGRITTPRASFIPTDANLGIPGRPQSATGQATILSGRNIPQLIGEHYGPKPNPAVAELVHQGTLFHDIIKAGGAAALLTPYPQGYFDGINSGKRLYSSVPLAATSAGLRLMTVDDLRQGEAISPDFTAQAWRSFLGYENIPVLSLFAAGERLAHLASKYDFSFFEHWPSDRTGHKGTLADAAAHLEMLDEAIGGLLAAWDDEQGLLVITSDHGNIEAKNHRQHTENPVPTLLIGPNHTILAQQIHSLADIAPAIKHHLSLQTPNSELETRN